MQCPGVSELSRFFRFFFQGTAGTLRSPKPPNLARRGWCGVDQPLGCGAQRHLEKNGASGSGEISSGLVMLYSILFC